MGSIDSCLISKGLISGLIALQYIINCFAKMSEPAGRLSARQPQALWNVTLHTNVIFGEAWKRSAENLTRQFQEETVRNIRLGYTGADPGVRIWTFSSALMYSITVFTTIGG